MAKNYEHLSAMERALKLWRHEYLATSVARWVAVWLCWLGLAGNRPAATHLSFASPKESKQRKGDPTVCDPYASLRGTLRYSL